MTDFKRLFFGDIPVTVVDLLDAQPDAWSPDDSRNPFLRQTYLLEHGAGIAVWVANSSWGLHVEADGNRLWGGVTPLSMLGLAPGHWLLWRAYKRWLRSRALAPLKRAAVAGLSS